MKQWIYFLLFTLLFSCEQETTHLLGKWKTNSNYYSAVYQIEKIGDDFQAQILSYNDGTTKYKFDGQNPKFLFTNLQENKNKYFVDGTSGATKTENIKPKYEIACIGNDSLKVTSFLLNKPLTEIWTRLTQH